jgi:hypothetical protein
MEENGHLDPSSNTDLLCLQLLYLPKINGALEEFTNGWNQHGLRTEHNWSPTQIFLNSRLAEADLEEDPGSLNSYGVDWEGPHAAANETEVEVLDISSPMSDADTQQLEQIAQENNESADFGLQTFLSCRNFVNSHLS